jgi:hypothetical protein
MSVEIAGLDRFLPAGPVQKRAHHVLLEASSGLLVEIFALSVLQASTAPLLVFQNPPASALWDHSRLVTRPRLRALHAQRENTAILWAWLFRRVTAVLERFRLVEQKIRPALLAAQELLVALLEHQRALFARPDSRPPQEAHLVKRLSMKKSF